MVRIISITLLMTLLLGITSDAFAKRKRAGRRVSDKLRELDDRLFDVEDKLSGKYPMTPIDALLSRFGGVMFHDQKMSFSEDYDGAVNTTDLNTETRIDLIFAGDISDELEYLFVPAWFFMSERNYADQADRNSKETRLKMNLVYRINGTYKAGNMFNVKFGRIVAPFSSYVDAYAPSSEIMGHWPQMVMPQGGMLYSTVLDGIQFGGTTKMGKSSRFTYRTYFAVHGTDQATYTDHPVGKYLFQGHPNEMLFGFRTIFDFGSVASLGFSFQGGKKRAGYMAMGTDINLNFGRFKITAEYMSTTESEVEDSNDIYNYATNPTTGEPSNSTSSTAINAVQLAAMEKAFGEYMITRLDSDKTSYYIQPSLWITDKFMLAIRYDYLDLNNMMNYEKAKTITGITFNYFPLPQLMVKLNISMHDYEAETAETEFSPALDGSMGASTQALANMMYSESSINAIKANPDYNEVSLSATLSF